MLDHQDKIIIREIVGKEISNKTSDLRQHVSILQHDVSGLKQDVSVLKQDTTSLKEELKLFRDETRLNINDLREENHRNMGVLVEMMKHHMELILEAVGTKIKEALEPYREKVFENHETRIGHLELVVKKKTDLRLI